MEIQKAKPKWSWWDVVLVLASLFAMMQLSSFFRHFINLSFQNFNLSESARRSIQLFTGTSIQAGVIILSVMFLIRRKGSTGRELGLIWTDARKNIRTGLVGGIILCITVIGLGALISIIIGPPPPQDVEKMLTGIIKGKDFLLPFISVSILAPVSEELYFRGMVYPLMRSNYGVIAALILSGLFFSTLHFDLFRLVPIWVGGVALAYFYEKTGSVVTSIIAHSTWNTIMLLMMYLASRAGY